MLAVLGLVEDGLGLDQLVEGQYRDGQVAELDRGGAVCEVLELSEARNRRQQVNVSKLRLEMDKPVALKNALFSEDSEDLSLLHEPFPLPSSVPQPTLPSASSARAARQVSVPGAREGVSGHSREWSFRHARARSDRLLEMGD